MLQIDVDSVAYKSVTQKGMSGYYEPSICLFTNVDTSALTQKQFSIEYVGTEPDEALVHLLCFSDVDDAGDEEEIEFTMPVSYLSLFTAFGLNPNPLTLKFYPSSLKDENIINDEALFEVALPSEMDKIIDIAEEIIPFVDVMRTMPMVSNIKRSYTGIYAEARGQLFTALSDIAAGSPSPMLTITRYLPYIDDYVQRLDDESKTPPETLLKDTLKDHDMFIEGLIMFLDSAFENSMSEAYLIDENGTGDNGISVLEDKDSDFYKIMSNSNLQEIFENVETNYTGVDTRTMRSQLTKPFVPSAPEQMKNVVEDHIYILLDDDVKDTYKEALELVMSSPQDDLGITVPEKGAVHFLAKFLIVAARIIRCAEGINETIDLSTEEEGLYPIQTSFLAGDFLSEDMDDFSQGWKLDALKSHMKNYDLSTVQNVLASSTHMSYSPQHLEGFQSYTLAILRSLAEHRISPDAFTKILSRSPIKALREENTVIMVSELYKTFQLHLESSVGASNKSGPIEVSITEETIKDYVVEFVENLLYEASEENIISNVDSEDPDFLEKFTQELAYQFSYVVPILADFIALESSGGDTRAIGSEAWNKKREEYIESLVF